MKIVESWLREWVDPELGIDALAERLTMAGHEVDELTVEGAELAGVVVGEVLTVEEHPEADRLTVCRVAIDSGEPLQIVCGAPNVAAGMKSPLAVPGVRLPNGVKLKRSKIRGVTSAGMLCSAAELGLGEEADGIMELAPEAQVGSPLGEYLGLPDTIVDLDLTPNRGDCFSTLGIARDVAALTATPLKGPRIQEVAAVISDTHPVKVEFPEGCPSFAGRVIRGIDPAAGTPLWMKERLRRSGLRPIHPVVDITNYVMLELGQPLHAYDLRRIRGAIRPRLALPGETVVLLDEKEVVLEADTIVISDDSGAIGVAGIMGGLSTAVSSDTVYVFFEGAYWPPDFMAGRARSYGLHTDASLRFERGVDPQGQARAVDRATALLLEIACGAAGPLVVTQSAAHQPVRPTIALRRLRLETLLGLRIDDALVASILERLGMTVAATDDGWRVTPPSYRFDVELEVDLIEEVARIHGYDRIPETTAVAGTPLQPVTESTVDLQQVATTLVARDYREVITYSFVDAASDAELSGVTSSLALSNPISSEMAVMRSSLLPGMLRALAGNVARQQERVRLFEIGKSFHGVVGDHTEVIRIAGVATGTALPEQWGAESRAVDFFDLKADIEAVVALADGGRSITCTPVEHPALQPGQAAEIRRDDDVIGVLGKLHPKHLRAFDLKRDVFVFELNAELALRSAPPKSLPISKYPSIRRDIAVVVDQGVSARDVVETVSATAPELIKSVKIFDVYQGPGIEAGRKSIALGLILQETSRTLTDVDADSATAVAVQKLQEQFAAELRD
jgi:phenylalanyl-tRNA synthetase beta chain